MKTFDALTTAELAKEEFKFFSFVEFQFSTTYRYTDCDINLWDGSNEYVSVPIKIDAINYSAGMAVDSVDVTIGNVDQVQSSIFLNEDVAGAVAILSYGCVNANHKIIALEGVFQGLVASWDLADDLRVNIKNEFVFWAKKTLRIAQASCPWIFKSAECGYTGAQTTCDKTYNRCGVLYNTDNYGGFRFLPAVMEKEIWWGKERG